MNHIRSEKQQRYLAKADAYRLLAACYYEPESSFLEEDVFGQMESVLSTLAPGRRGVGESLGACFREAGQDSLVLDYARLFLGPFGILAKPYGSVYLDGENVVMGESTLQAQALYREGGFQVSEAFQEMPDHVAAELEFLYLLDFTLGSGEAAGDNAGTVALKRRFLEAHLGCWVTPFTEAMHRGAETDFYRSLAALTRSFVLDDLLETKASSP